MLNRENRFGRQYQFREKQVEKKQKLDATEEIEHGSEG